MKQFDLQGNEYDCTIEIPLKKATYEDIQALNIDLQTKLFVKDKEIERLHSIIKEVREAVENDITEEDNLIYGISTRFKKELLEILDKEK